MGSIIVRDIEQGSPQWFEAKAGRPGASSFERILTSTGKLSTQQTEYIYELCGEKLLGRQEEGYNNQYMQRGSEMEEESRTFFELKHKVDIEQVGLIYKDESKRVLCSPDGIGSDFGLEMKNRMLKHHMRYLATGKLLPSDFVQVQGSMWVTGWNTWWFMSYYPGIPPFELECHPDKEWQKKFDDAMNKFLDELDETYNNLIFRLRGE